MTETDVVDAAQGLQALKTAHDRSGLAIHGRTCIPKWLGERIDYGEVIGALQDRRRDRGSACTAAR